MWRDSSLVCQNGRSVVVCFVWELWIIWRRMMRYGLIVSVALSWSIKMYLSTIPRLREVSCSCMTYVIMLWHIMRKQAVMKNQIVRMVQKLSYHCIGCYPCNYSIIRIRHSHRSISLHLLKLLLFLLKLQHLLIKLPLSRDLMHRQAHLHLDLVEELTDSLLSPQVVMENLITLQLENVNCHGNATVDSPLTLHPPFLLLLFLLRHLHLQLLPAVDYRLYLLQTLLALTCPDRRDIGASLH